jgi:hypothetical protein
LRRALAPQVVRVETATEHTTDTGRTATRRYHRTRGHKRRPYATAPPVPFYFAAIASSPAA